VIRPRRNFACFICIPLLLLLLPLLWWLLSGPSTTLPDCDTDFATFETSWSSARQQFCCQTQGRGCTTESTTPELIEQPTPPPTPPPSPVTVPATPGPKGDPYNCAVGAVSSWGGDKKSWCCRIHHVGCPPTAPPPVIAPPVIAPPVIVRPPVVQPPVVIAPPAPADPYNCADGFSNWQAGWSIAKKAWCCKVHSKGCPGAGGCATTSAPYDCNAGFANWQAGWSLPKKDWCCKNGGKGCPPAAGGCA